MDERRFADYYKKLERKSVIRPESLGTTSDTTAKHHERVYHIAQNWRRNDLPPEQWGRKMLNRMRVPVQMAKLPAPHELMKIVTFGCKIGYTTRCTCITHGLKCTSICTGCSEMSCQNCVLSDLDVEV